MAAHNNMVHNNIVKLFFVLAMFLNTSFANAHEYSASYNWNQPEGGWGTDYPVIIRLYTEGNVTDEAVYDNNIPADVTTIQVNYLQEAGRHHIYARAEKAPGYLWEPAMAYEIDQIVMPTVLLPNDYRHFICTRAGSSGGTEPAWPTLDGSTINDPDVNGAEWAVVVETPPEWQPETEYAVGDLITPSIKNIYSNDAFRCEVAGTSGSTEPDWWAGINIPWFRHRRAFTLPSHPVFDPNEVGVRWQYYRIREASDKTNAVTQRFTLDGTLTVKIGRSRN